MNVTYQHATNSLDVWCAIGGDTGLNLEMKAFSIWVFNFILNICITYKLVFIVSFSEYNILYKDIPC